MSTVSPTGGVRSCSSATMWLGTEVAACTSPIGVVPTGLTGRSWACASAATRSQQRTVLLQPGEILAGGDGRADAPAHGGQPFGVPPADRLLDPGQVEGPLQFGDVAHRLLAGPGLVGVQHEAGTQPTVGA